MPRKHDRLLPGGLRIDLNMLVRERDELDVVAATPKDVAQALA